MAGALMISAACPAARSAACHWRRLHRAFLWTDALRAATNAAIAGHGL